MRHLAVVAVVAVACSAGPLQWGDATMWDYSSRFTECTGVPAAACGEVAARARGATNTNPPSLSFGSIGSRGCLLLINPTTGAVTLGNASQSYCTVTSTASSPPNYTTELRFRDGTVTYRTNQIELVSRWDASTGWYDTGRNRLDSASGTVTLTTYYLLGR